MSRFTPRLFVAHLALIAVACDCGGGGGTSMVRDDAASPDSAAGDAGGSPRDAGQAGQDASGDVDGGGVDGGGVERFDGAIADGAIADGAIVDAGSMDASATDSGCVPVSGTEMTCDDIDDDCNGLVDDIDVGGDGIYDCLRIALIGNAGSHGSSNFNAWLTMQGTVVDRLGTSAADPFETATIASYDVVILDQLVRDYTPDEAAVLAAFVEGGGGVMSMSGYTGGAGDFRANTLYLGIGLEYIAGLRNGPVTTFHVHPTTSGLTSVSFLGGFRINEVTGVTGGANTVVAELADGPAAMAQERGAGRVFVWGDEWVQFDSEWSSMPEIQQFWVNVLGWLSGTR